MKPDEALLLRRCRSVHTFGMRFAIDAVSLDRRLLVRRVTRMPPGRLLLPRLRTRHVFELAVPSRAALGTRFQKLSERSATDAR